MEVVIEVADGGFCFGVRRAAQLLESALADAAADKTVRVRTLGKLIHNDEYVADLALRGAPPISEEQLPDLIADAGRGVGTTLVTRAHGVTAAVEETLAKAPPSLHVIDGTCPCVARLHQIARESAAEGAILLLMGDAHHPEVLGTRSHNPRCVVAANAQEAMAAAASGALGLPDNGGYADKFTEKIPESDGDSDISPLYVAAQTTFSVSEWKKTEEFIKKLYTKAKIFGTICGVTEKRQREAALLSERADAMFVIGGAESSNTRALLALCKNICPLTFAVSRVSDAAGVFAEDSSISAALLCMHMRHGHTGGAEDRASPPDAGESPAQFIIGVTAGASAPDELIGEIVAQIKSEVEKLPWMSSTRPKISVKCSANQSKL